MSERIITAAEVKVGQRIRVERTNDVSTELLAVIDHAAALATNGVITKTLDPVERYETAWGACAVAACEHLRDTGETPRAASIVAAGLHAIGSEQWQWSHDRGIGVERGHLIYWDDPTPQRDRYADLVNRRAIREVLDALDGEHRAVIETVAALDSIPDAARVRGEAYATTARKYRAAREAAYALWFDGQVPPPVPQPRKRYQRLTHCLRGHERTPDNVYRNGDCKACTRARRVAS